MRTYTALLLAWVLPITLAACKKDAPQAAEAPPRPWYAPEPWKAGPEVPQPLLQTVWKLSHLPLDDHHPAVQLDPRSQAGFVIFEADGSRLTGFAGCQPLTGVYHLEGEQTLAIEAVARTGARCHKAMFDTVGDRFATALSTATGYRLGKDDAVLELLDGERVTATLIYREPPPGRW
ncbi:META domain-containing protein [Stenotrophomonas maltophilia]|uniref:META domain-containing protein n=1 Tax=Stenotrophomonas maltophilia TaxID=40324 RepID=UPI002096D521|nr:META domain-containing protein [Stenotrophomonas maltophilia]MCO7397178.1 META domain-containing protein [Stenotrophomonas maltophilia]MCO7410622.1 META domain-containing protein [Stenotrophomonas maltophilia]HDS1651867.1 META domain-containing protein [Stenotrophomonas maltophilia]